MKVKLEDILIWIFIAIAIGAALWLLHGSPPEIDAVVAVGIAIGGSELLIWKKIFSIDNKTSVSFLRLRSDMDKRFAQMENNLDKRFMHIENNFEKINIQLNSIESKLRKR